MSYIGYYNNCFATSSNNSMTSRYNIVVKSQNFSANKFEFYAVNTSNNSIEVNLPEDVNNGDWIGFTDKFGTFDINNLIIKNNNGTTIRNNNGNLIADSKNISFMLVYNELNWFILDMSFVISEVSPGSSVFAESYDIIDINNHFTPQLFKYYAVTSTQPITVTLPSNPTDGDWFGIIDQTGSFSQYPLSILYDNVTIGSNDSDLLINTNFINFKLVYNNNNWLVLDYSTHSNNQSSDYAIIEITSNATLQPSIYYLVDTSNNSITLSLPSSPTNGYWVIISDKFQTFETNNVIITGNGKSILNNIDGLIIDVNNSKLKFTYFNDNWDVISLI